MPQSLRTPMLFDGRLIDWLIGYEDMPQSLRTPILFDGRLIDWLSTRICLEVCALPCYSMVDWLIEYEYMPQSLCTPMLFDGWLIDWLGRPRLHVFSIFSTKSSLVPFSLFSIRSLIAMPIGRLELTDLSRFGSGKYRLSKCADFVKQNGVRRP